MRHPSCADCAITALPPLAAQTTPVEPPAPSAKGARPAIGFEFTLAWPPQNGARQTPSLIVPGGDAPARAPQPASAPSTDVARELDLLKKERAETSVQSITTELGAFELTWEKLRARYIGRRGAPARFDVAYVNGTLSQSSLVNLDAGEAADTTYDTFVARRIVAKGEGTFAEAFVATQLFHGDAVLVGEVRAEWIAGGNGTYLFTFGLYALRE